MQDDNTLLDRDCPMCGQSGLCSVRLELLNDRPATLCNECERMWLDDAQPDPSTAIDFIQFMEERGLSTRWDYVHRLT